MITVECKPETETVADGDYNQMSALSDKKWAHMMGTNIGKLAT